MNAGQIQRDPFSGKLRRNPTTGKIIRASSASDGICCCKAGCPCGGSGSRTLGDTIMATVSGVVVPIGVCFRYQFDGVSTFARYAARFNSFSINGTFCLARIAGTCSYTADFPIDVDIWEPLEGGAECDCNSYTPFCQHTNGNIGTILVRSLSGQLAVNAYVAAPSTALTKMLLQNVFASVTLADSSQLNTPIPCSGSATCLNKAAYYATDVDNEEGVGLFVGSDLGTVYRSPGYSGVPVVPPEIDGGWPPPTTPFNGQIVLSNSPC